MQSKTPRVAAERRRSAMPVHRLLFPAAAVAAIVWPAAYLLQILDVTEAGLVRLPLWHGHEMIFGYALALVGGYLLAKHSGRVAFALFAAWLLGRVAVVSPAPAAVLLLVYPAVLCWLGGVPFLRAAKNWRNRIFIVPLVGFLSAESLFVAAVTGLISLDAGRALALAGELVLLLVFTMGGRIIGAANSGAFQRRGKEPPPSAQPGLEAVGLVALLLGAAWQVVDGTAHGAGVLVATGGFVTLLRLVAWRSWSAVDRPEVGLLILGYLALALGLIFKGVMLVTGQSGPLSALHPAMIGGLGTLSVTIMVRVSLQRQRRPIVFPAWLWLACLLPSMAAVTRGWSLFVQDPAPLLVTSAVLWAVPFAAFLIFLMRLTPAAPKNSARIGMSVGSL